MPKLILRKISPREYESLQGTTWNGENKELLHFKRHNQNKKVGLLFSNTSHTLIWILNLFFSEFTLVSGINLNVPTTFSFFKVTVVYYLQPEFFCFFYFINDLFEAIFTFLYFSLNWENVEAVIKNLRPSQLCDNQATV